MDEKLRWFKFYPQDFLLSQKVQLMTDQQIGWYLLLLIHQWLEGSIPIDSNLLAVICRTDPITFQSGSELLLKCFPMHGKCRLNPKLNSIKQEHTKRYHELSEAGRKGGRKRGEGKPGLSQTQAELKPGSSNRFNRLEKNRLDLPTSGVLGVSPSLKPEETPGQDRHRSAASNIGFTPTSSLVDLMLQEIAQRNAEQDTQNP